MTMASSSIPASVSFLSEVAPGRMSSPLADRKLSSLQNNRKKFRSKHKNNILPLSIPL
jgi:hypothetical protein